MDAKKPYAGLASLIELEIGEAVLVAKLNDERVYEPDAALCEARMRYQREFSRAYTDDGLVLRRIR